MTGALRLLIFFIFVNYNYVMGLFKCVVPKTTVRGLTVTIYCSGTVNPNYRLCICVISRERCI